MYAVDASSTKKMIELVNLEYSDKDLLRSILMKISRKFYESNPYTKLKSMFILHKVMEFIDVEAQLVLSTMVHSLRTDTDGKLSSRFFSLDSIEESAKLASNVVDLQTVELTRMYTSYVLQYLTVKGVQHKMNMNAFHPNANLFTDTSTSLLKNGAEYDALVEWIDQLMVVLTKGVELENWINRMNKNSFMLQCQSALWEDRSWIVSELSKLHLDIEDGDAMLNRQGHYSAMLPLTQDRIISIESILLSFNPKFKPTSQQSSLPLKLTSSSTKSSTDSIKTSPMLQHWPPQRPITVTDLKQHSSTSKSVASNSKSNPTDKTTAAVTGSYRSVGNSNNNNNIPMASSILHASKSTPKLTTIYNTKQQTNNNNMSYSNSSTINSSNNNAITINKGGSSSSNNSAINNNSISKSGKVRDTSAAVAKKNNLQSQCNSSNPRNN